MAAGQLREKVAFDRRSQEEDGFGNFRTTWSGLVPAIAARIQPLRGSEEVQAQRLQGVQPYLVKVRRCAATLGVKTSDRVRNLRTGAVYDIRTVTPDEAREYVDLICVEGSPDA